ncbi:MAG: NAD(P)-dependent oxidoreductase [Xanthomonadaceae bacterium]|nr:NAD(P)-dependent oxidoreductase [Xanthomonadaceae bacterium]MBU6476835.1 NAD(P)-dependent oxidoreductase [Xanthomonadaceae bacterium]MDE2053901.1 NAD(P)-dependent oxidoreductase [Xanthomonadaceae bacterium]MDE2224135.1 NAD(P)-dependent oxidoreductase [Xanthomonadaceae bacterium]
MKIALIGSSGRVGSRLLAEMSRRGHEVTGIARNTRDVSPQAHLTFRSADANQPSRIAPVLRGHDAVVSAMKFAATDPHAVIAAVKQAAVKRLMVVGGAGSLEVSPGVLLMDTADFPDAYKPEAAAGRKFLGVLRDEKELDWTFLSPSAEFVPGERTGTFRLGHDQLLIGADGKSWISMEDYAIAFVDELETPRHTRQRFTVGY